jgi:hypothetical protein
MQKLLRLYIPHKLCHIRRNGQQLIQDKKILPDVVEDRVFGMIVALIASRAPLLYRRETWSDAYFDGSGK